jgi:hypothetical protein
MELGGNLQTAHMPARSTVHMWLLQGEAYERAGDTRAGRVLGQFVRARQVQADTLIDDILEIAADTMNDWVERENARTGQYH